MHRAWQIEEIRRMIFERCGPRELARLARCSTDLFDPATDALWFTIKSFEAFMCVLPADVRTRNLELRDLVRLDYYARKVQAIHMESHNINNVILLPQEFNRKRKTKQERQDSFFGTYRSWRMIWDNVRELRPAVEFLPNLRRLRISVVVEVLLYPLVGISGARLEYVYIKYIHNREPQSLVRSFLDQLADVSRLEYLFVRDGEPDHVPLRVIRDAPLTHLRLDKRISNNEKRKEQFKRHRLRLEILEKSSLEHLTLGLAPEWNDPKSSAEDVDGQAVTAVKQLLLEESSASHEEEPKPSAFDVATAQGVRYLPALKTLWLNLIACPPDLFGEQSPAVFLRSLDRPKLELLNIKFRYDVTSEVLLGILRAAKESCRLQGLLELALTTGGHFPDCWNCTLSEIAQLRPNDLMQSLESLLPLPHLQVLRLSMGPDLLETLYVNRYRIIAAGLPALKTLHIGRGALSANFEWREPNESEASLLNHVAAFCVNLPNLEHVSVDVMNGQLRHEPTRSEWICPQVESVKVGCMRLPTSDSQAPVVALQCLGKVQSYFPNAICDVDEDVDERGRFW